LRFGEIPCHKLCDGLVGVPLLRFGGRKDARYYQGSCKWANNVFWVRNGSIHRI
jgi:hypothetical protein